MNQIIDELLFLSRADAQRDHGRAEASRTRRRSCRASRRMPRRSPSITAAVSSTRTRAKDRSRSRKSASGRCCSTCSSNALERLAARRADHAAFHACDGVWRVSVEDEGPGLTAEQRERIFERFVRFTSPGAEDKGSGLGLAICRSIVQLHKGASSPSKARTAAACGWCSRSPPPLGPRPNSS